DTTPRTSPPAHDAILRAAPPTPAPLHPPVRRADRSAPTPAAPRAADIRAPLRNRRDIPPAPAYAPPSPRRAPHIRQAAARTTSPGPAPAAGPPRGLAHPDTGVARSPHVASQSPATLPDNLPPTAAGLPRFPTGPRRRAIPVRGPMNHRDRLSPNHRRHSRHACPDIA